MSMLSLPMIQNLLALWLCFPGLYCRDQTETGDQIEGIPKYLSCKRGMTEKSGGYTGGPPPHHLGGDIGAGQGQRQG